MEGEGDESYYLATVARDRIGAVGVAFDVDAANANLIAAMHTALPSLLDAADERDAIKAELAERIEINSRNVAAVCAQRDALAERLDEMTRQRDAAAEDAEQWKRVARETQSESLDAQSTCNTLRAARVKETGR
jgi:hypothetical protein